MFVFIFEHCDLVLPCFVLSVTLAIWPTMAYVCFLKLHLCQSIDLAISLCKSRRIGGQIGVDCWRDRSPAQDDLNTASSWSAPLNFMEFNARLIKWHWIARGNSKKKSYTNFRKCSSANAAARDVTMSRAFQWQFFKIYGP